MLNWLSETMVTKCFHIHFKRFALSLFSDSYFWVYRSFSWVEWLNSQKTNIFFNGQVLNQWQGFKQRFCSVSCAWVMCWGQLSGTTTPNLNSIFFCKTLEPFYVKASYWGDHHKQGWPQNNYFQVSLKSAEHRERKAKTLFPAFCLSAVDNKSSEIIGFNEHVDYVTDLKMPN